MRDEFQIFKNGWRGELQLCVSIQRLGSGLCWGEHTKGSKILALFLFDQHCWAIGFLKVCDETGRELRSSQKSDELAFLTPCAPL